MLVNFFQGLKDGGVPVTPRELLDLLAAMNKQLVFGSIDDFYNLSRAVMVKDEKYYDRFDRAFGLHFRDLEGVDVLLEKAVALLGDDGTNQDVAVVLHSSSSVLAAAALLTPVGRVSSVNTTTSLLRTS